MTAMTICILISTQMRHYKRWVYITEWYLILSVDLPLLVWQVMADMKGFVRYLFFIFFNMLYFFSIKCYADC